MARSITEPTPQDFSAVELRGDASVRRRQVIARTGRGVLFFSLVLGLVALLTLFLNVFDKLGGYAVYAFKIDPLTITPSRPLEELSREELLALIEKHVPEDAKALIPEEYGAPLEELSNEDLVNILYNDTPSPETLTAKPLEALTREELIEVLQRNVTGTRFEQLQAERPLEQRTREELIELVEVEVLQRSVVWQWTLFESIFNRDAILAEIASRYPGSDYEFKWWLTPRFIASDQTTRPETTGLRPALLGSLLVVILSILFAVPIGVAAGIYLEEFAGKSRLGAIIQTNIYNLAGVPSIIYGMLGLAVFARALRDFTTGAAFGVPNPPPNGRTIITASLTMALLILPLIIVNTQEAIRAVPQALRDAALAVGATKWETVWHHVLPVAAPGILTGTILATARALGETAPLIVVGAAAYVTMDPQGIFSSYTVLPIQIYTWTKLPEQIFTRVASAAVVVLLVTVLAINLTAIILRNRLRKQI
ncbi:MAG: phosphate ABC transporter permease PstA [Thermoflexales bacterium]|nr:phosphate ABC transporter permease PstA [Thermoflexales bacterium]MCS7324519.1 phosphate ABC transporter permease PstA [Thermoflexales bacterium]MDW8054224.1 phosphate ABC transporter permease PstA [Anaerolineae bacterium]MDW8292256.1 phosphate ABC transporter permease PstA [Anaerolineae bacterium]